eukprot:1449879-Rhodomonas_salina.1
MARLVGGWRAVRRRMHAGQHGRGGRALHAGCLGRVAEDWVCESNVRIQPPPSPNVKPVKVADPTCACVQGVTTQTGPGASPVCGCATTSQLETRAGKSSSHAAKSNARNHISGTKLKCFLAFDSVGCQPVRVQSNAPCSPSVWRYLPTRGVAMQYP